MIFYFHLTGGVDSLNFSNKLSNQWVQRTIQAEVPNKYENLVAIKEKLKI
jgi:hypothetical protein